MDATLDPGTLVYWKKKKKYQNGEIIAFKENIHSNYSFLPKSYYESWVFRIVAQSGDTLEIDKGNLILNGNKINHPKSARLAYEIIDTSNKKSFRISKFLEMYNYDWSGSSKIRSWTARLTRLELEKLKHEDSLLLKRKLNKNQKITVPNSSPDFYGPIHIPSKGDTVKIGESNRALYRKLFNLTEYRDIEFINPIPIHISEKLYFVLGDNMSIAEDSKYIGLIPESYILGSVKIEKPNKKNFDYRSK